MEGAGWLPWPPWDDPSRLRVVRCVVCLSGSDRHRPDCRCRRDETMIHENHHRHAHADEPGARPTIAGAEVRPMSERLRQRCPLVYPDVGHDTASCTERAARLSERVDRQRWLLLVAATANRTLTMRLRRGSRNRASVCRPLIIACRAVAPDQTALLCLMSYIAPGGVLLFPVPAEVVSPRGAIK